MNIGETSTAPAWRDKPKIGMNKKRVKLNDTAPTTIIATKKKRKA